jgi:hypothetical protein
MDAACARSLATSLLLKLPLLLEVELLLLLVELELLSPLPFNLFPQQLLLVLPLLGECLLEPSDL